MKNVVGRLALCQHHRVLLRAKLPHFPNAHSSYPLWEIVVPATDLEKLIVQLSADINRYEKALARAQGQTNTRMRAIERRARQMSSRLEATYANAGKKLALIFAGAASLRGAQNLIDTSIGITNALKVAGLEGDNLKAVYESLKKSALDNAAPLDALVTLYSRASQSAADLGASQEELLRFTDGVSTALRASGQSAAESSGALLQLSQALGNGVVQAEEYNSLLDAGRPILTAVAAGLKEAGGSVSALTRLVKSQKISSEAFFRAFLAGVPVLKDQLAGATLTISQRMERLRTVLIDAAGRFNTSSEAASTFGKAIDNLTAVIANVDFDALITGIQDVIDRIDNGIISANSFAEAIGRITGLDNVGRALDPYLRKIGGYSTSVAREAQGRVSQAFERSSQDNGDLTPDAIVRSVTGGKGSRPSNVPSGAVPTPTARPDSSAIDPVSIADYPANGKGSGGGRGRGARAYENESKQIRQRTEAINAMTAAQASVNPLIDDYGFAVAKAGAKQDLLNAAERQGLDVTPALEQTIDQLATGYANAEVAANRMAESQDKVRQSAQEMRDLGRDVLGGFISDIEHGTSAADALSSALGKIGDKLLDMALNDLFDPKGGNLLGSLFGGGSGGGLLSFLGFRAAGGPVQAGHPYIVGEKRPELFVPNQSGTIVPQVPTLPTLRPAAAGGMPSITYAPVYNVTGSGPEIDALRQQIAKDQAQFPAKVIKAIHGARKHSVRV